MECNVEKQLEYVKYAHGCSNKMKYLVNNTRERFGLCSKLTGFSKTYKTSLDSRVKTTRPARPGIVFFKSIHINAKTTHFVT